MLWHSTSRGVTKEAVGLEKFLKTPLRSMRLRDLAMADKQYIRTAIEQLGARTARCYRAFSSEAVSRTIDHETKTRLWSLRSICKREFECLIEMSHLTERYLELVERGEVEDLALLPPNEISHEAQVDSILHETESGVEGGASIGIRLLDALEDLRPHENTLHIAVNEHTIQSPELNRWLSCFCRRRVSWRVIHEHLLHLLAPRRYPPVVRVDPDAGAVLRHTSTVVAALFAPVVDAIPGAALTIRLEERAGLRGAAPTGRLSSSADIPPATSGDRRGVPPPSPHLYSIEGHLEYVFRELMKNACVAMLRKRRQAELSVQFDADDAHIVVDITDSAGGICPESMEKIWHFGWTTNARIGNAISGFGVGLSASKVYTDLWGGRIDVYTTPGVGTTARVTFPKAATEVLLPQGGR